jgi:hypothetical protein
VIVRALIAALLMGILIPLNLIEHFHFETLPPNLWIVAIINIHAGVKAMKTLWRSVPNG